MPVSNSKQNLFSMGNCKQKHKRGQASLIAIGVLAWLSVLVLGQFQTVLLLGRTDGYQHQEKARRQMFHNALIDTFVTFPEQERGETSWGDDIYQWTFRTEEGERIQAQSVALVFPQQQYWPRITGLLIEGEGYHLLLKDFRSN